MPANRLQLLQFDQSMVSTKPFHSEFTECLKKACSKINKNYINFHVYGQQSNHRERVYCYELYHQLRCNWKAMTSHLLNGEVDKVGHHQLKKAGLSALKPDFIVHVPGNEAGHTVIEVKPTTVRAGGIIKDLRNLCDFVAKAHYQRAIFLIYGPCANQKIRKELNSAIETLKPAANNNSKAAQIEIWFHEKIDSPAEPAYVITVAEESFPLAQQRRKKV